MKRCLHCGAANPHNMTVCYACVQPLDGVRPARKLYLSRRCRFCGARNLQDRSACDACGDDLGTPEVSTVPPGGPQPEPCGPEAALRFPTGGDPDALRASARALRAGIVAPPQPAPPVARSWWRALG